MRRQDDDVVADDRSAFALACLAVLCGRLAFRFCRARAHQPDRRGIEVGLFLRPSMELARFGAVEELGLDQMGIGNPAPDAVEADMAIVGHAG